jgi:hypothetical protein
MQADCQSVESRCAFAVLGDRAAQSTAAQLLVAEYASQVPFQLFGVAGATRLKALKLAGWYAADANSGRCRVVAGHDKAVLSALLPYQDVQWITVLVVVDPNLVREEPGRAVPAIDRRLD